MRATGKISYLANGEAFKICCTNRFTPKQGRKDAL